MVARARLIKPEFFTSEQVCRASMPARLLFIGLWTFADIAGRMRDDPWRFKLHLFPADAVDVDALLDELDAVGLIRRYAVDGARYLDVPTFAAHQHFHPQERQRGSHLPECPSTHQPSGIVRTNPEHSGKVPAKPAGSSGSSGSTGSSGPSGSCAEAPAAPEPAAQAKRTARRAVSALPTRRVPPTFTLTDERRAFALEAGLPTSAVVGSEFAKFQDHEFQRPHSDWSAAWRNWVRRAVDLLPRNGTGPPRRPMSSSEVNQTNIHQFLDEVRDD